MAETSSIKTVKVVKEEVDKKNGTKGAEQNCKKREGVFYEPLYQQVPISKMADSWTIPAMQSSQTLALPRLTQFQQTTTISLVPSPKFLPNLLLLFLCPSISPT